MPHRVYNHRFSAIRTIPINLLWLFALVTVDAFAMQKLPSCRTVVHRKRLTCDGKRRVYRVFFSSVLSTRRLTGPETEAVVPLETSALITNEPRRVLLQRILSRIDVPKTAVGVPVAVAVQAPFLSGGVR